jgi:hypothetical protein
MRNEEEAYFPARWDAGTHTSYLKTKPTCMLVERTKRTPANIMGAIILCPSSEVEKGSEDNSVWVLLTFTCNSSVIHTISRQDDAPPCYWCQYPNKEEIPDMPHFQAFGYLVWRVSE